MGYKTHTTALFDGKAARFSWLGNVLPEHYSPITQSYGIVFKENLILVCSLGTSNWAIPGGTVEPEETLEETLSRELNEEVDVTVKNIKYVGLQKAETLGKPEETVYQARFVADLDKELPQTIDPDKGKMYNRIWVPQNKIKNMHDGENPVKQCLMMRYLCIINSKTCLIL